MSIKNILSKSVVVLLAIVTLFSVSASASNVNVSARHVRTHRVARRRPVRRHRVNKQALRAKTIRKVVYLAERHAHGRINPRRLSHIKRVARHYLMRSFHRAPIRYLRNVMSIIY